jgi:hypothetical protein
MPIPKKVRSHSELNADIYVWNIQSTAIQKNAEMGRKAAPPLLGIFWVDTEDPEGVKVYSNNNNPTPRDAYRSDDGWKVNTQNHSEIWGEIQKQNKKWIGKNYMSIPRGRISLNTDPENTKFIVSLPEILKDNVAVQSAIMDKFYLPSSMTEFNYTDPHYKIRS